VTQEQFWQNWRIRESRDEIAARTELRVVIAVFSTRVF
jgi:hypothetical protein